MEKKSVGVNAILNVIKQCSAIIFPLITFPYISRVLGADVYGMVNFGHSIVDYFVLIAAFGISTYAIREGARIRADKKKFEDFSSQVFTINVITTIIAYAALIILVFFWTYSHNYLNLIFVYSFTMVLTTIGTDWVNSIYEDYTYITLRYIFMHIISLVLMFVFVKSPDDYVFYAFTTVLAGSGAYILNIFRVRKYVHIHLTRHPNIKLHIKPMLMLFCNAVTVQIYVSSDVTILGVLQDDLAVGIYSAAVRVYTIVKQLINAVVVVTIPRISALLGDKKNKEYNDLLGKTFNAILTLVLPAIVGIFILSYEIICILGGIEYVSGYWALRILSIALAFSVFANFFNNAILIPNKQEKYFLQGTVTASISNVVLNFVLIPYISYIGAAITTVLAEGIVLIFGVVHSKGLHEIKILKRDLASTCIGCILIIVICIIFKNTISTIYIRVICCCVVSVVAYFITLIILKNSLIIYILNRRKRRLHKS